jgi:hypothetical protein
MWGDYMPEDKGMQTLLMIASCLCLFAERRVLSLFVGPILLGAALMFKALGIFLVPMYLFVIYQRYSSKVTCLSVAALTVFAAAVWLIPFGMSPASIMYGRLIASSGAAGVAHQVMWVFYENSLHLGDSALIRYLVVGALSLLLLVAFLMRRLDIFYLTAAALYIFTNMFLNSGSLDRMGIALLISISVMGISNPGDATRLAIVQAGLFGFIYLSAYLRNEAIIVTPSEPAVMFILGVFFGLVVCRRVLTNFRQGVTGEFPLRSLAAQPSI